jgi:ribosomal-protein-alanine N-acetyltransferase
MHLLNLSVAPDWQGRGLAGLLLDRVLERCAEQSARQLWLEVRVGNERARRLYRRRGFDEVGLRPRYYPAAAGAREDALVMKLEVPAHALG